MDHLRQIARSRALASLAAPLPKVRASASLLASLANPTPRYHRPSQPAAYVTTGTSASAAAASRSVAAG